MRHVTTLFSQGNNRQRMRGQHMRMKRDVKKNGQQLPKKINKDGSNNNNSNISNNIR
jgi:hypothetical protein